MNQLLFLQLDYNETARREACDTQGKDVYWVSDYWVSDYFGVRVLVCAHGAYAQIESMYSVRRGGGGVVWYEAYTDIGDTVQGKRDTQGLGGYYSHVIVGLFEQSNVQIWLLFYCNNENQYMLLHFL